MADQSTQFLGDLIGAPELPDLGASSAPKGFSRRQWLATAGGILGAGAVAVLKGNDIWKWIETSVLEVPAAIREAYRDPNMTEDVVVARQGRHPYPESTMEAYAAEERRLFPDRDGTEVALIIATNIANRVAVQAQQIVQEQENRDAGSSVISLEDALARLSSTTEGLASYMKLIGRELIRAGCFYKVEGSLDSAVDESRHNSAKFHLDCDLLCHLALHCAFRHDMPIHGVRAPGHMYIGSPDFGSFAIEMTAFRGERIRQQNGLHNESVVALGAGYVTSQGAMQAHFAGRVSHAEIQRLGYYTPLSMESMREGAVGNLLVEVLTDALQNREPEQLSYICAVGDRELSRFTGKDLVAQNVYALHGLARDYHALQWQRSEGSSEESRQRALFHAHRIERLKSTHGEYISMAGDLRDKKILGELENNLQVASVGERRSR